MASLFLLVLLALAAGPELATPAALGNNSEVMAKKSQPPVNTTQRQWISQVMAKTMPSYVPWSKTNIECTMHGILYKNDIANLTLWAVQMLDSSALSEIGIISGNGFNFGNYDQCIALKVPEYNIRGKYCLAKMKFSPTYYNINEPHGISEFKQLSPLGTVWNKFKRVSDERIKKRDRFFWAICIPSSCSHLDAQESLSKLLQPAFKEHGISIEVTLSESDCEVEEPTWDFTTGAYVYLLLVGAFSLFVLTATIVHCIFYESYTEEKEDSNMLLFCSIISNTQRLLQPDSKSKFRFISGIKVLSMFLIIYGHRMLMSMYWPLINVEDQEKKFDTFLEILNLNGPIIVNTFLLTTGFLMFNKLLRDISKNRRINILLYIFYRWARTTPVYAFVICSFILIKPLNKNDPLYKREALWRIETCSQNFWAYMLYINNYYKPNTECLLPAWYLAVDMQLYIVCTIIGYIFSKSQKCGYALLGIFCGIATVLPGIITYSQGLDATLRIYLNFVERYYENHEYVNSYVPTHMRAGPYVMGMLTALLLMKLKEKNYGFTMFQRMIGVSVALLLGFGSILYAWVFYIPDRPLSFLENGLYVSIHRLAWSFCIAWLILVGVTNGFGKLSPLLGAKIYGPLNKLTLNVLLIHTIVQGETFLNQRHAEYVNFYMILWKTCGDIMVTYILSYFLYVFIEAPIARFQDFGLKKLLSMKNSK